MYKSCFLVIIIHALCTLRVLLSPKFVPEIINAAHLFGAKVQDVAKENCKEKRINITQIVKITSTNERQV